MLMLMLSKSTMAIDIRWKIVEPLKKSSYTQAEKQGLNFLLQAIYYQTILKEIANQEWQTKQLTPFATLDPITKSSENSSIKAAQAWRQLGDVPPLTAREISEAYTALYNYLKTLNDPSLLLINIGPDTSKCMSPQPGYPSTATPPPCAFK